MIRNNMLMLLQYLQNSFNRLIHREKLDYVQWRKNLWQGETLESLSEKAQRHFQNKKSGHEK